MEEKIITKLGGSLKVPYVQELAKDQLAALPSRYVARLSGEDPPIISLSSLPEVPVIDMHLLQGDLMMESELNKFHHACKQWGFFQLINHGVSTSLVEEMKVQIQEFFKLPIEEKIKYDQLEGDIEGYGQAFVVSQEQKLDWADIFYMVTLPKKLRKPHLFPKLPLPFRDVAEAYSAEIKGVAMKIIYLMAQVLKMEKEDMKVLFEEGMQAMRMNYYPPCPQPDLAIGLTPHSDGVGLTILLQVNEMEGLEIRKDGHWIPVKPLPNAFIVNIGDMLEIVTNGIYRSVEHRATVNSKKERLSIATFYSPNVEGDVGPAPSLVSPQTPPNFITISVADFFKGLFARKLDGKSYVDVLRI